MSTWQRQRAHIAWWVIALGGTVPAHADSMAYNGTATLQATAGPTTAEHHHNWDWNPRTKERKEPGYVRLLDAATGREIVKRPSPPLRTLWLTPDGRFLVGLSSVKLSNKVQLLVVSRDGSFVHEEAVRCGDPRLAGTACAESVTNHVSWYDAKDPGLELTERDGRALEVSVNAADPQLMCVGLHDAKGAPPAVCTAPRARLRFALGGKRD